MSRLPSLVQLAMQDRPLPVGYSSRGWAGMPNPWKKRAQEEALEELRRGGGGGGGNQEALAALRAQLRTRAAEINKLRQELDEAKERAVELRTEKSTAELDTKSAELESANALLETQQLQRDLDDSEAEVARLRLELASAGVDQDQGTQALRTELEETTEKLRNAEQALAQPRDSEETATLRDQVEALQRADRDLRQQVVELEAAAREEAEREQADPEEAAELVQLREELSQQRSRADRLQALRVIEELAEGKAAADFEKDTQIWNLSIEALHAALKTDNARRVLETDLTMEDPNQKERLLQAALLALANGTSEPEDVDQFFLSVAEFINTITEKEKLSVGGRERLSRRHVWDMFRALIAAWTARPPDLTERELTTDKFLLAVAALPTQVFTEFIGAFDNFLRGFPQFPDIFDGDIETNPLALSEAIRQAIIVLETGGTRPLEQINEQYFVGTKDTPGMKSFTRSTISKFDIARNGPLTRRNVFRQQYIEEAERAKVAIESAEAAAKELAESSLNKQIYERWSSIWRVLFEWGDKYYPTDDPWMKYMLDRWQGRQGPNPTPAAQSTYLLVEPEGPALFFANRQERDIKEHLFGFRYVVPTPGLTNDLGKLIKTPTPPIDKLLSKEELRGLLHQLKKRPRPVYRTYVEEKATFEGQDTKPVSEVPEFAKLYIERVENLLGVVDKANEALRAKGTIIPPPSPWAQQRLNFIERQQLQAQLEQLLATAERLSGVRDGQERQEQAARARWEENVRVRVPLGNAIQALRVTDAELDRTRKALEAASTRLNELRNLDDAQFDLDAPPPAPSQEGLRERTRLAVAPNPVTETPKTVSQIRKLSREPSRPDATPNSETGPKLAKGLLGELKKRQGQPDDEANADEEEQPKRPGMGNLFADGMPKLKKASDRDGGGAAAAEPKKEGEEPKRPAMGNLLAGGMPKLRKAGGDAPPATPAEPETPPTPMANLMQGVLAGVKLRKNAKPEEKPAVEEATAADDTWLTGVQRVVGQGKRRDWMLSQM